MMNRIVYLLLIICHLSFSEAQAQVAPPKDTPQLEFAMQLRVTLGQTYTLGETPHGRRIVIPITGGTFEGPLLHGTILNGGADYQLASVDGSRTELEAIYSIQTHDGTYIHVRNRGIIHNGKDAQGQPLRLAEQCALCLPARLVARLQGHYTERLESQVTPNPNISACRPYTCQQVSSLPDIPAKGY